MSLIDAIDQLAKAVDAYWRNPHPTEAEWDALARRNAHVLGLCRAANMPDPPNIEAAGLMRLDWGNHHGTPLCRFRAVPNAVAYIEWRRRLDLLRVTAAAAKGELLDRRLAKLQAIVDTPKVRALAIALSREDRGATWSVRDLARSVGCHAGTLYRYKPIQDLLAAKKESRTDGTDTFMAFVRRVLPD